MNVHTRDGATSTYTWRHLFSEVVKLFFCILVGLEPATFWLRVGRLTAWATEHLLEGKDILGTQIILEWSIDQYIDGWRRNTYEIATGVRRPTSIDGWRRNTYEIATDVQHLLKPFLRKVGPTGLSTSNGTERWRRRPHRLKLGYSTLWWQQLIEHMLLCIFFEQHIWQKLLSFHLDTNNLFQSYTQSKS